MEGPLTYLLMLQHLVRVELRSSLADLDLTPEQNTVLALVAATPGTSSAELARAMHVTPQTMHKIVAELERRGLVSLEPRPGHGRILEARLTDHGRDVKAKADQLAQVIEDRMIANLDRDQRRQFSLHLVRCVRAMEGRHVVQA